MNTKIVSIIFIICFLFIQSFTWGARVNTRKIVPKLLFQGQPQGTKDHISSPRDFTIDPSQNIYIFDYMTNRINKYDHSGRRILSFGKKGDGNADFKHLLAIKVYGNQLVALDSAAALFFTLDGGFLKKQPFKEEVLCEHPEVLQKRYFTGEQIVPGELKKVLTVRNFEGVELQRLASHDLKEFFPRLGKGKDFFLQDTYARFYLYGIDNENSIIWAISDQYCLYRYQDNKSNPFVSKSVTPIPFPQEQIRKMEEKQKALAKNMPTLHMYVPRYYPILGKLFIGNREIWVYVMSKEREGFVRYTMDGKEKGFYTLEANMDILNSRINIFNDNLYFMVPQRKMFKIYIAPLPKE